MQAQLEQEVSDMLLQAFKTAPIRSLSLVNIGAEGSFAVKALENNTRHRILHLEGNHIESEQDALSLVQSINNHPSLDALLFRKCGIGQSDTVVMAAILSVLDNLREVDLVGNCIGTNGVKLISACLANNPTMQILNLEDNSLNNKDE